MVDRGRRSDKLHFKYKSLPRWDESGNETPVRKPVIEITFRKYSDSKSEDNPEIKLNALIDSGADWSFLPLEIAQLLKLDIDESDSRVLTVAGDVTVFQSKVYVEIPLRNKLPVSVGMVHVHIMPRKVGKHVPQFVILGRKDFFEKFEVTVNEHAQFIVLRDVHPEQLKKTRF